MKLHSYRLIFRLFSFLSDKTNGFSLFAKYKLAIGTLILGLTATSCAEKKNTVASGNDTKEDAEVQSTCYFAIIPTDEEAEEKDTLPAPPPKPIIVQKDTLIEHVDCYIIVPEPMCYEPAAPPDTVAIHREAPSEMVYSVVDTPPVSPFGDLGQFGLWVHEKVVYPQEVIEMGIQGRTTLKFVIDTEGNVTDITVLRGIDPKLDAEFIRVISSSPKWQAGKLNGKPVRVALTLPFLMPRFNNQ